MSVGKEMKRILIRSGLVPFTKVSYEQMISENILGSNVGNLVYAYSVYKTLMVDENIEFVPTKYKYNYSQEEIERFNDEYECFVIPLADAIRPDFVKEMKGLTKLVRALRIPCYVIGMGIRAPYEPGEKVSFEFDDVVKDFVKAVLEKSQIVGIRGTITAKYLRGLGFIEEKDFTVIGCPSMYMHGEAGIKIRNVEINPNSFVCYNENTYEQHSVGEFIRDSAKEFKNAYFIPQHVEELKIMYAGVPWNLDIDEKFPTTVTNKVYTEGNCRFFGNVPSWIEWLRKADFCFGSRLHGNIVSSLAGTPSVFIAIDARSRELAEYHGLTSVSYQEIDKGIWKLIEQADFHSPEKKYKDNFRHYVEFLNKLGVRHIYEKDSSGQGIMDSLVRECGWTAPLESITNASKKEMAERLQFYHSWAKRNSEKKQEQLTKKQEELKLNIQMHDKKIKELDELLKAKEKIIKDQEKIVEDQSRQLNYKSIRATMKVRNAVAKTGIIASLKKLK